MPLSARRSVNWKSWKAASPADGLDLRGRLLLEPLGGLKIGRDVTDRNSLSGDAEAEKDDCRRRDACLDRSTHLPILRGRYLCTPGASWPVRATYST